MSSDIATCPICRMRVLPAPDGACPSCRAYDFTTARVLNESAAKKASARVKAAEKPRRSLHPLAVVSCLLALGSATAGPYPAIGAGLLAAVFGWWASRNIRASAGTESGLWLARIGVVVGLGVATAWTLVLVVARHGSS